MTIPCGLYRSFKGKDYLVFKTATHTETRERMVCYRRLYDDYSWWVRPLAMFLETVELAGETLPRFGFLRSLDEQEIARYLAPVVDMKTDE